MNSEYHWVGVEISTSTQIYFFVVGLGAWVCHYFIKGASIYCVAFLAAPGPLTPPRNLSKKIADPSSSPPPHPPPKIRSSRCKMNESSLMSFGFPRARKPDPTPPPPLRELEIYRDRLRDPMPKPVRKLHIHAALFFWTSVLHELINYSPLILCCLQNHSDHKYFT